MMVSWLAIERELVRDDFGAFSQKVFGTLESTPFEASWSHEHLAYKLECARLGEINRLIINVPPRSGKSILASVAWPMFLLGHNHAIRIICVSHTEDLARKFSVDRRQIALSPWYRRAFPDLTLTRAQPRDVELSTTVGGSVLATGIGGSVHGRGADVIIVDDPVKGLDALSEAARRRANEFFVQTLLSRLNDKRHGIVVIIMQRLHEEDLVGFVTSRGGDWDVVSLPAIATEDETLQLSFDAEDTYRRRAGEVLHAREPLWILEQIRRDVGSYVFEPQYQQSATPAAGNVIKRGWLRFYDVLPPEFERIVVSWDTASTLGETSDWSVGTVWGALGLEFYLIDVLRARMEAPELRHAIIDLTEQHRADATLIEDTELGRAICAELRNAGRMRPVLDPPRYDKVARLLTQAARFEAGQVLLPREASWLGPYMTELLAFPTCAHDDQVDSTSQALRWLNRYQREALGQPDRAASPPLIRREIPRRNVARRETRPVGGHEDDELNSIPTSGRTFDGPPGLG